MAKRWKQALRRTKDDIRRDNLSLIAAGVAFYAFLSLFPALAAVIAIYGLIADPSAVQRHMQSLDDVIPAEAQSIVEMQLERLASGSNTALGISAIIAILVAIWSANKATKGIFQALTVVYDEEEQRGFFELNFKSFLTSLVLIVGTVLLIGLIAVVPAILGAIGLGGPAEEAMRILRWPLALGFLLIGLAILYRIGPDREAPKWRWISPGAVIAAVLWLVASIGLSFFVAYFGNYNETYGSVGAVVVLMLWLLMSAYAILIGGELNAALEREQKA